MIVRDLLQDTNEEILNEILSKLRIILIPFKKRIEGWKKVAESIIRDSSKAIKGGRLFNFYIIWKVAQGS